MCEGPLREGGDRINAYTQGGERIHPEFTIPQGCKSRSITRHNDVTIVGDIENRQLHVINDSGMLTSSIKLKITPSHIASSGESLFVWNRNDRELYRVNIDTHCRVDSIERVEIKHPIKDSRVRNIAASRNRVALCYHYFNKVCVYTHSGELVFMFAEIGRGENQLFDPYDVVIDSHNTLYITDNVNKRIVFVGSDGRRAGNVSVDYSPDRLDVYNNMLSVAYFWSNRVSTYSVDNPLSKHSTR